MSGTRLRATLGVGVALGMLVLAACQPAAAPATPTTAAAKPAAAPTTAAPAAAASPASSVASPAAQPAASPSAAASPVARPAAAPGGPLRKVTFMLPVPTRTMAFFPYNVAQAVGFYAQEGLDVEVQTSQSSPFVVQQLVLGRANAGGVVAGVALNAFSQNQPVVAVCEQFLGSVFTLWVPADSPIQSFTDLKGKKIGVESLQGGHMPELRAALANVGLTVGQDVQLMALGDDSQTVVTAFNNKTVDAFDLSFNVTPGPRLALDLRGVPQPPAIQGNAREPILVNKATLQQDRQMIIGLVRATMKALIFGSANPDAVMAIQKQVTPSEFVDPQYAQQMLQTAFSTWANISDPTKLDPNQQFCNMPTQSWESLMTALLAPGGGLTQSFDVKPSIDASLIQEINNFDRQAVVNFAKSYKQP